jgi:hypothetical protein
MHTVHLRGMHTPYVSICAPTYTPVLQLPSFGVHWTAQETGTPLMGGVGLGASSLTVKLSATLRFAAARSSSMGNCQVTGC